MARLASVVALVSLAACAQPQPHAAPAAAKTATPQRVDETAGIDAAIAEATTTTSTSTTVAARPSRKRAVPARPNLQQEQGGNGAGDLLDAIARCESGGRAHAVSRTGRYRGAWQFDQRTWDANAPDELRGVDPASLPYETQKEVARTLLNRRGTQPWPTCAALL